MPRLMRLLVVSWLVLVSTSGPGRGEIAAQGNTPAVGYRILSPANSSLVLYRFRFQPQASIPGPYAESMLISVNNGTFLLYLGQGAQVALDPRGTGSGQVETLKPTGASGGETTFEDIPANQGPTFACSPTCQVRMGGSGLEVIGGSTVGNVAIKLKAGVAVALTGPTSGFVCNTGDGPGRIDIAVAGLIDPQQFGWLAYATQQSSAEIDAGEIAHAGTPDSLKAALLPARNPGGCAGKTG